MSETGETERNLREANAKLRSTLQICVIIAILCMICASGIGLSCGFLLGRDNSTGMLHAPPKDAPVDAMFVFPTDVSKMWISSDRIVSPWMGFALDGARCLPIQTTEENHELRWACSNFEWKSSDVRMYATPDADYLSCVHFEDGRFLPQSCVLHVRGMPKSSLYYVNALHENLCLAGGILVAFWDMLLFFPIYYLSYAFALVCEWTWCAPMGVAAFYLTRMAMSRFPRCVAWIRSMVDCVFSDETQTPTRTYVGGAFILVSLSLMWWWLRLCVHAPSLFMMPTVTFAAAFALRRYDVCRTFSIARVREFGRRVASEFETTFRNE